MLGDEFVRDAGGAAAVVAATHREGRYRLRLDNGTEKLLRLDSERFRLLRYGRHSRYRIIGRRKIGVISCKIYALVVRRNTYGRAPGVYVHTSSVSY